QTFADVLPGLYRVIELQDAGQWELTDISCIESGVQNSAVSVPFRAAEIQVDPGETITCTFSNQEQLGRVVIQKTSVPAGGQGFSFSGDLGAFNLNDAGSKTVIDLAPGTYTVTEDDPTGLGFGLSGITCVDDDPGGRVSTGDVGTRKATIELDPAETVTCTFINTENDTITVEKVTIPPSSDSFGFDAGTLGTFTLLHGDIQDFTNVTPGQYTITEDDPAPAGYQLVDIRCEDSATGQTILGDLGTGSVDLTLTAGERVHCTFTNMKLGTVIIKKATSPAGGAGFSFSGDLGSFVLKDGSKQIVRNVTPGSFKVTEDDPTATGFKLSGISCVDTVKKGGKSSGDVATATANIILDPGETVTCTFTIAPGTTFITVEKVTSLDSTASFGFDGGTPAHSAWQAAASQGLPPG
ncbi:MAG: hypothetical protein R3A10_23030, partial [Caldilineaceae bacterium]